jgi:hypothetical protein
MCRKNLSFTFKPDNRSIMRRTVFRVIAGLLSASSAVASEIREFSIPTLERFGVELSRRDTTAARASDLVLANIPS